MTSNFTNINTGRSRLDGIGKSSSGIDAQSLSRLSNQFNQIIDKIGISGKKLENSIDTISKTFEKLNRVITEVESKEKARLQVIESTNKSIQASVTGTGSGGGGGGNAPGWQRGMQTAGGIAQGAAQVGGAALNVYEHAYITSDLAQHQQRINQARMANDRFNIVEGAASGDMRQLRRYMQDQYGEQREFGGIMRQRSNIAEAGKIGVAGANTAAAGIDAALGFIPGFNMLMGGGGGGAALGNAANSAAATANQAINFKKDLQQSMKEYQAYQQGMQADATINQVPDYIMQQGFSDILDIGRATRGLGTGTLDAGYGSKIGSVNISAPETAATKAQRSIKKAMGTNVPDLPAEVKEQMQKKVNALDDDMSASIGSIASHFGGDPVKPKGDYHVLGYKDGMPQGYVTSKFGRRNTGITGASKMHMGIDYGLRGTDRQLHSPVSGKVVDVGYDSKAGNYIKIKEEGTENIHKLLHMESVKNLKGKSVKWGQQIGVAGDTGVGNAPHVDHRIQNAITGKYIDPLTRNIMGKDKLRFKGGAGGFTPPSEDFEYDLTQGGGDREKSLSELINPASIREMAYIGGLSTKEVAKLTQQGVGGLGKEFMRSGKEDVIRAGQLARVGYMQDPTQYMKMRSQMTDVSGEGSENLEVVMKNAVAAGMDTSKNIQQMVSGIVGLSRGSAAAGIDVVAGTTGMMGRGVEELANLGVSENMRASAAAQSAGLADQFGKDKGQNLFTAMEWARMGKQFSGAKLWEKQAMQSMTVGETQALLKAFDDGKEGQMLEQLGLSGAIKTRKDAEALANMKQRKTIGMGVGIGIDEEREEILDRMMSSDPKIRGSVTAAEKRKGMQFMNAAVKARHGKSGASMWGATDYSRDAASGDLAQAPAGAVGVIEDGLAAPAMKGANIFNAAVKEFATTMGGFSSAVAGMVSAAQNIGKVAEQTGKQAAGGAANMGGSGMSQNDQQVYSSFTTALENFTATFGNKDSGTSPKKNTKEHKDDERI